MKVLVVGANGFLGSHLVKQCQLQKWSVYGTYNTSQINIPPGCHTLDIKKLWICKELFTYVFLIASKIPYPDKSASPEELIATNIELPLLLTKKFPDAKIIFSSSVSVYGHHRDIMTETSSFNYPNLYGLSKIGGECIMRIQKKFSIIRFSSLIGRGMYPGTFLPHIIADAKKKNTIILLGKGLRKQDYLHISDAATLCIKAAKHPINDVFLGVSGLPYSNITIARLIQQYLPGITITFKNKDTSPSSIYNNTYTAQTLRFSPQININTAIKEMID